MNTIQYTVAATVIVVILHVFMVYIFINYLKRLWFLKSGCDNTAQLGTALMYSMWLQWFHTGIPLVYIKKWVNCIFFKNISFNEKS